MQLHQTPFNPKLKNIPTKKDIANKTQKEIGSLLWDAIENKEEFKKPKDENDTEIFPIIIESDDSKIQALPWELLFHNKLGFLATHPRFTLSREIPTLPISQNSIKSRPLKVLFFSTLPDDLQESERLAVEHEQVAVLQSLLPFIKQGLLEIKMPNDGRFETLEHLIKESKPDLLFFSGHSIYHEGKGYSLFEDKRGLQVDIEEEKLASIFIDSSVECVVLSSCQSAQFNSQNLNSGLAQALAFGGVTHVIGMSDSIYDKAGAVFAENFIVNIVEKNPIAQALQKSREEISKIESIEATHWNLPLLISQDIHKPLVDWSFEPKRPSYEQTKQKLNQIDYPQYFIGRRYEFRKFYNYLYDNQLKNLLLYGEGGIGKTSMVAKFALELKNEGYRVFDFSLKRDKKQDWKRFLGNIKIALKHSYNREAFSDIQEAYSDDPEYMATAITELLLDEYPKVVFIFDNLESIQNHHTKEIEDETIKAWIEALSRMDDVVVLMSSRWDLPQCKEKIQLGKPLKMDFLYFISMKDIDFRKRRLIDRLYETMGGNYRGIEFIVSAMSGMSDEDEDRFLEKLSTATKEIQTDMAIEEILKARKPQEIELLERSTVYPVSVPRDGIRKISLDLPKEALDILVSFSLMQESYNREYEIEEYQISALVFEFLRGEFEVNHEIGVLASDYQLWLFFNERKDLKQGLIAHEALNMMDRVVKLEVWLFQDNEYDKSLKSLMLNNLGFNYIALSDNKRSLLYLSKALKMQTKINNKKAQNIILTNLAILAHRAGKYKIALSYLDDALKMLKELGDKKGESAILNNFADIYISLRDYEKALSYLEQALIIQKRLNDLKGQLYTFNNLASIYIIKKEYIISLSYLKESLKISKNIGYASEEGTIYNNIAQTYERMGDNENALYYLERAEDLQHKIKDNFGLCATLFNLGHILKTEPEKAVDKFVMAYVIAKQIGDTEILYKLNEIEEKISNEFGLSSKINIWEFMLKVKSDVATDMATLKDTSIQRVKNEKERDTHKIKTLIKHRQKNKRKIRRRHRKSK